MNPQRETIMDVSQPYRADTIESLPQHIRHFVDADGRDHESLRVEIQVTGFRRVEEGMNMQTEYERELENIREDIWLARRGHAGMREPTEEEADRRLKAAKERDDHANKVDPS